MSSRNQYPALDIAPPEHSKVFPGPQIKEFKKGEPIEVEQPQYLSGEDSEKFLVDPDDQPLQYDDPLPEVITETCGKCGTTMQFIKEIGGMQTFTCMECGLMWGKVPK